MVISDFLVRNVLTRIRESEFFTSVFCQTFLLEQCSDLVGASVPIRVPGARSLRGGTGMVFIKVCYKLF